MQTEKGYEQLIAVFQAAHDQAAHGKGKERHANNLPFHKQRMQTISQTIDSEYGMVYQVTKKMTEGLQFTDHDKREAELLGAINYLAGIVIYHRQKQGSITAYVEDPNFWLPHETGQQPVADDDIVDVAMESGRLVVQKKAKHLSWLQSHHDNARIVSWRPSIKNHKKEDMLQENWPAAADDRMLPIMQNGNTGEHYDVGLEWIEHDGSACPVPASTLVMITTRDGNSKRAPAPACDWYWAWHDRPTPADITHYKALPPGDE